MMGKPHYIQKFRQVWLNDPIFKDWLQVVESTAGPVAKCKICSKVLTNRYSEIKSHSLSKKHKSKAVIVFGNLQPKIMFQKDSATEQAKVAECRIAIFIAQHTAISITDHIVPVCKNVFSGDAVTYLEMHRTKCSGIIQNVLEPHFRSELRNDIADNQFSVLLDESTDISTKKYLGLSIIYFGALSQKMVYTFMDLAPLDTFDADGIIIAFFETLGKLKLPIKNLVGIGTDNASVMTGIHNGVYQKLKAHVPNLVLIRCVCHSLQLAVSAAAKACLPRNLEFLIRETYDWFSRSSSRQDAYKTLFKSMNDGHDPLKITQSSNTRWLSIESAVTRIYNQWRELKTHFNLARNNEKCYTAELLYQMYTDNYNYAFICFLKPLLSEVQAVNKLFESNNVDPTKLLDDLMRLLLSLTSKITLPTTTFRLFKDNIEDFVDKNCYLGYLFENKLKEMISDGYKNGSSLRDRCIDFILKLVSEIKNRLPDNVDILKKMSLVSVDSVLRANKNSLVPLLEHFSYEPTLIDSIEKQWRAINLVKWNCISDTYNFWYEVNRFKDSSGENPFKDLVKVALSFLSLPHSNAEVERLFSQMNIIKTKYRNKMKLPLLNAILTVRSGLKRNNKCCHDYNITKELIKEIKTMKTYSTPIIETGEFDIFI